MWGFGDRLNSQDGIANFDQVTVLQQGLVDKDSIDSSPPATLGVDQPGTVFITLNPTVQSGHAGIGESDLALTTASDVCRRVLSPVENGGAFRGKMAARGIGGS